MIEVRDLTKRYGKTTAVDGINFVVKPGHVTGFLGPNGAGKSTTMRIILGLDRPTSGETLVKGESYINLKSPLSVMGSLLEAKSVDKGRSAFNHLSAVGATMGIGKKRINEVLEMVGIESVSKKNANKFSLGMSQRLGIATALLADPEVLMLDEPVNGLDPDGILWIRNLLKDFAQDRRTVLLSSHLMSEMELTADHLIVIGKGKILADTSMAEFIARSSQNHVKVVSPHAEKLRALLEGTSAEIFGGTGTEIELNNFTAVQVGEIAAANQIVLHQLIDVAPSLEDAFMEMTQDSVAFHGHGENKESR